MFVLEALLRLEVLYYEEDLRGVLDFRIANQVLVQTMDLLPDKMAVKLVDLRDEEQLLKLEVLGVLSRLFGGHGFVRQVLHLESTCKLGRSLLPINFVDRKRGVELSYVLIIVFCTHLSALQVLNVFRQHLNCKRWLFPYDCSQ